MSNFYIIYGTDSAIIKNELNNIITTLNIDDVIKYTYEDEYLVNIINDALTISMFSNKKIIVVDNADFLKSSKSKDNMMPLEEYINHYNKNTFIIFTCYSEKLDSRKKIVKLLLKNSKVIEVNPKDKNYLKRYINNILENNNYKMEDIDYFILKAGSNLNNIKNELDKLLSYKINNKKIDNKDIDNIVSNVMEEEIFALTDAIINKDSEKSLYYMNEFLNKSYDEVGLVILIANQFIFLYQVKRLLNKGMNNKEIASVLEVNPYRVRFTIDKLYNYTEDDLIKYIKKLYKIDKEIKLGKINKHLALEMFIISNT